MIAPHLRESPMLRPHLLVPSTLLMALVISTVDAEAQIRVFRSLNPFELDAETAEYRTMLADSLPQGNTVESSESSDDENTDDAREKKRLEEIKKWVFDRRPSTILKVWSEPPKEDDPVTESPKNQGGDAEPPAGAQAESSDERVDPDTEKSDEDGETATLTPEEQAQREKEKTDKEAKEKAERERKEREKREDEQFEETKEVLSEAVTKGNWANVRDVLCDRERLSAKEAVAAYDRLLDQLSSSVSMDFAQVVGLSEDMQKFMQQMMGNQRNNPAVAYAEKHIINTPDVVGILEAAPPEMRVDEDNSNGDVESDRPVDGADSDNTSPNEKPNQDVPRSFREPPLRKISKLLKTCLERGNPVEEFVEAMKLRTPSLLPEHDAARLLSWAGQDVETIAFLPSREDAFEANDIHVLNLLAKHYLARHRSDHKESFQVLAWHCTLDALKIDDPDAKAARSEALSRVVALAPSLEDELGKKWLQASFTGDTQRGQEIMSALGTATSQRLAQTPQDADRRGNNLKLQSAAVDALFAAETQVDATWRGILNLLASSWLQEAGVTYSHSTRSRYGSSMRRDRYGNLYYVEEDNDGLDRAQQMVMRQINPVDIETVLDTAPKDQWLDAVDDGLKPKYTMMMGRLWLKVNEAAKAFPFIESLASTHPETALELAEEFLRVWTKDHNPNQESQRTNSYMFIYGFEQKADKIPLTRSKQQRNLKELSTWVRRLRKLPFQDELDEELLVGAFMTCHSVAEVYDVSDIEIVFGAWSDIEAATMAKLIDNMRSNLAGIWRDPNVQRDRQTKRKKKDIQAEVVRGYTVAKQVLDSALTQHPGDWRLMRVKACVMHDENDFLQEMEPSSEFSARRQAALDVFASSAERYVSVASDLAERDQSNEAFDHWFYASLGAADLDGISEKNRPDKKQIAIIKQTMARLTGDVGKRHQERFANALFTRMSAVSPSCKFRYLDAGFQLVDPDDPKAVEARKVYDYYKDLVTELQLVTRIDGSSNVGHTGAFGVYVDLRHTKELEREAGGFGKYLQNQKSQYFSFNYGRPTENYRDKFEDALATALEEHFEVLSVTFNHSDTKSRDVSGGWRVTPYAYLLLKARGEEVDKLPALQMDMDFLDTSGYVVLPIESSPLPLDASGSSDHTTSTSKLTLVELLDERQASEGKLIVELRATAQGLVPDLDTIVDTNVVGYRLAGDEDSGVSVIEFDKESTQPVVLSERTWTLNFEASDPSQTAPTEFSFPAPLLDVKDVTYQRYVDADLEDVEATVSLVERYGSNRRTVTIASAVAGAVTILFLAIVLLVRSRTPATGVDQGEETAAPTPFSLLSRLRQYESGGDVQPNQRAQLQSDITAIESHFFAAKNGHSTPDLVAIANRWA